MRIIILCLLILFSCDNQQKLDPEKKERPKVVIAEKKQQQPKQPKVVLPKEQDEIVKSRVAVMVEEGPQPEETVEKNEIILAVPISGCVITEQEDGRMYWERRCNYCGYQTSGGECDIPDPHVPETSRGTFTCRRCKEESEVLFKSIVVEPDD